MEVCLFEAETPVSGLLEQVLIGRFPRQKGSRSSTCPPTAPFAFDESVLISQAIVEAFMLASRERYVRDSAVKWRWK